MLVLKSSGLLESRVIATFNRLWLSIINIKLSKEPHTSTGILVPGGFGTRGVEGKIAAARWARENKKPYLGICLGLQCAVIEFARNVLQWKDAHTTEIDGNTKHPVVIEMPEHNYGNLGGTMRLGKWITIKFTL